MFANEPGQVRPPNLLIVGPTNNGKTMIAERFLRDHPPDASDDDDREIIPVLAVQMPAVADPDPLPCGVLAALNSPVSAQGRTLQLEACRCAC